MNKYDISVIIPIYNNEKFLRRSINSVINQTFGFERIELILVDDLSTDSSREIMDDFNQLYENCKCIYLDKNSGSPCTPRNTGIENALGEYLMFLDADDTYDSQICEKLYDKIVESGKNIVGCQWNCVKFGEISNEKKLWDVSELEINPLDESILLKDNGPRWWMPWDKIYRKTYVDKFNVRFPNDTLAEDVIFNIQFFANDETMIYLNDYYGYNWTILDEGDEVSLCHAFHKKSFLMFLEGYKVVFNIIKDKKPESLNMLFDQILSSSLFAMFCLIKDCDYNSKIEILEELYSFVNDLNLDIKFSRKWARIFNYFLCKKQFRVLIFIANIISVSYKLVY